MWIVSGIFRDQDTKEPLCGVTYRLLKPGQIYKAGRGKEHLLSFAAKYASSEHFSIKVGEHTEAQAADPSYIPPLTLVAQPQGPSVRHGGPPKTFAVYLTKKSQPGKLITEGGEFELLNGDEIRINKPDGVAINIHWKPIVLHNASNMVDDQRSFASYIPVLASMGVKTHRSSSDSQTHTILPQITGFSAPVIQSVIDQLQLISPKWIRYIVGAGDAGQEGEEKFWSSAELDFETSWPNEDDFRPEIKINSDQPVWSGWKDSRARIRPKESGRECLFGGLTFYVVASEANKNSTFIMKKATETFGAKCSIQDSNHEMFADTTFFRTILEKAKHDADDRYARFLRYTGNFLPEESKGSGLLLLYCYKDLVDPQKNKTQTRWTHLEGVATELGLVWLNEIHVFRAILEVDVIPLLKFGRTDEQPLRQYLPSQVGDSMEPSNPFSNTSPSSRMRARAFSPSSVEAGSSSSKLTRRVDNVDRDEGTQADIQDSGLKAEIFRGNTRRARTPAQDVESISSTAVASSSGTVRKPLVRRRPVHRAPLDDLVASLLDEDIPPPNPARASSSMDTTRKDLEEPDFNNKLFTSDSQGSGSSFSARRLIRRDPSRRNPEETYSYVDDPSIVIEESSKPREVYDRIRQSAKHVDIPMSTKDDEDDEEEEDFIEESKRKLRLKKEQERGREQEAIHLDRERMKERLYQQTRGDKMNTDAVKTVHDETKDSQRQSAPRSPSDLDGPSPLSARNLKSYSLSRKPSGLEMPPPSIVPQKDNDDEDDGVVRKKRPAEDDLEFLIAPSKRKKGTEIDPLDAEFNKLKLARQNLGDEDPKEEIPMEGCKINGFAMVCVVKPLLRKDPRVERPETNYGAVPNFKKFKKQHVVRSAPIKLVGVQIPSIRSLKTKESQSSIKIPESNNYSTQLSTSISNPTQSLPGPRLSQRKRLLRAYSESNDEDEGSDNRPNVSKRAKIREGSMNQKPIVLSSDDEEPQIVQRNQLEGYGREEENTVRDQIKLDRSRARTPASRVVSRAPIGTGAGVGSGLGLGGNRKKLILVDSDSEEEVGGFKGFGGGGKSLSHRR
ncbi:hypothetical protein [Phaffia rhodozyma]|uniref:Uncharacterized protein n=1 Tax=Phaffia rhodozyma TaxID=264483 RepID=A0A0F7SF16_PHARH|nr:hypothetical protein [Phaffia rhodozyma]